MTAIPGLRNQRWINLLVPDFSGSDTEAARSYLRLGARDPSVPVVGDGISVSGDDGSKRGDLSPLSGSDRARAEEMGEDLACLVADFWDDYRDRGWAEKGGPVRQEDEDGSLRAQETDCLHTKGGWRDHTDGNRITTTRGDKVEVIGGNYRLLVLGRSHPGSSGDLRDSSGGLAWTGDDAPGTVTEIKWVERFKDESGIQGTWMVKEETSFADTIAFSTGYTRETHRGRQDSVHTGDSYSFQGPKSKFDELGNKWPSAADSDMAELPGNDHRGKSVDIKYVEEVYEETHADRITSITGSTDAKVASITEETHAELTVSKYYGRKHETFHGGQLNMDLAGKLDLALSEEVSISAGNKVEVRGGVLDTVLFLGANLDFALGGSFEMHVPARLHIVPEDAEITALKKKVSAHESHIGASAKYFHGLMQMGIP